MVAMLTLDDVEAEAAAAIAAANAVEELPLGFWGDCAPMEGIMWASALEFFIEDKEGDARDWGGCGCGCGGAAGFATDDEACWLAC